MVGFGALCASILIGSKGLPGNSAGCFVEVGMSKPCGTVVVSKAMSTEQIEQVVAAELQGALQGDGPWVINLDVVPLAMHHLVLEASRLIDDDKPGAARDLVLEIERSFPEYTNHKDVVGLRVGLHFMGDVETDLDNRCDVVEDARDIRDAPDDPENWRPSKQDGKSQVLRQILDKLDRLIQDAVNDHSIASDRHDWDGGIVAGARVNAYAEAKALVASAAREAKLDSGVEP